MDQASAAGAAERAARGGVRGQRQGKYLLILQSVYIMYVYVFTCGWVAGWLVVWVWRSIRDQRQGT